jgi:hypothetical protein
MKIRSAYGKNFVIAGIIFETRKFSPFRRAACSNFRRRLSGEST